MVGIIIAGAFALFGFMCIGILSMDISDAKVNIQSLQNKLEVLRVAVDAHEEIILKEIAKNEMLEQQLIEIQNRYVKVKRDNENLAHRLARGANNDVI